MNADAAAELIDHNEDHSAQPAAHFAAILHRKNKIV